MDFKELATCLAGSAPVLSTHQYSEFLQEVGHLCKVSDRKEFEIVSGIVSASIIS